jgi:6-phosphogluconolactonase
MSFHSYIYENPQDVSAACAVKMLKLLDETLASSSLATLAVSGGSTPKLLFAELAKAPFAWSRVHLFWVDERGVPATDPQSNYKLTKEHWLDPAGFPAGNVHRIHAELEPETAARLYEEDMQKFFRFAPGTLPSFDIIHCGMGPDAHTASLFPGEPLINDHRNLAAATAGLLN